MEQKLARLKVLLLDRLSEQGVVETGVPGVSIFRRDEAYKQRSQLYAAQIILLAQGRKDIYWGNRRFVYDPGHYYVQTVPLPVVCEAIVENEEPILGLIIQLDPQVIREMLSNLESLPPPQDNSVVSLYSASTTETILDAALRLLECLGSRNETKVLGQVFLKELLFRVLCGEKGEALRELALSQRGVSQVTQAIHKIHEEYAKPLDIPSMAREAGMSTTAFYSVFKSVTSTSPLQYIKNIRLHKAKELIQQEGEKAYEAALRVGYESASQFSREYKRCFGTPPAKDRLPVPLH